MALASDLDKLIDASGQQVVAAANAALTTQYWQLGHRVLSILDGRRAEYGAQVIAELGRRLAARHGRGFDEKTLRHMVRFAEAFPDAEIVSALPRQCRGVISSSSYTSRINLSASRALGLLVAVRLAMRWRRRRGSTTIR